MCCTEGYISVDWLKQHGRRKLSLVWGGGDGLKGEANG